MEEGSVPPARLARCGYTAKDGAPAFGPASPRGQRGNGLFRRPLFPCLRLRRAVGGTVGKARECELLSRVPWMWLRSLSLIQFRNYARLEWRLEPRVIMVYGGNAQGKTNLLEAIACAAMGHSFRTGNDRELIHWAAWQDPMPFARVSAEFVRQDGPVRLELTWVAEQGAHARSLPPEAPSIRKQVRINGIPHRMLDLFGQAAVVLFTPQDVEVVSAPPAERRRPDLAGVRPDAGRLPAGPLPAQRPAPPPPRRGRRSGAAGPVG